MKTQLTFRDACRLIKDAAPNHTLLDALDNALGILLIFSPVALGLPLSAVEPALGLLTVKNELIRLAKALLDGVANTSLYENATRAQAAYTLLVYTSYFESLPTNLPHVWAACNLQKDFSTSLLKAAADSIKKRQTKGKSGLSTPSSVSGADILIDLPHPAEPFLVSTTRLQRLYVDLTGFFLTYLEALRVLDPSARSVQLRLAEVKDSVAADAVRCFTTQYQTLCINYPDFYTWANLHEHEATRAEIRDVAASLSAHVALAENSRTSIDAGFQQLSQAIQRLPHVVSTHEAHSALQEVTRYNEATFSLPIIADAPAGAFRFAPGLAFPRKSDLYLPQAFKVTRYTAETSLSDELMWQALQRREDLGSFLLSFVRSPHSFSSPLLILGLPGSGKSTLTEALAVALGPPEYCTIRVVLRDVNPDADPISQIEEQLHRCTRRDVAWAGLTDAFGLSSPVVIFDGLDELLQVSGKVLGSYLMQLRQFQLNEQALGRPPVRVIVTSRLALIDKATVPPSSTVIHLEPFDDKQIARWANEWNRCNSLYFSTTSVQPFTVPNSGPLLALAAQPVLLFLLALIDSVGNELHRLAPLDEAGVLQAIIGLFAEREIGKAPADGASVGGDRGVEGELERLGAVALVMFNARKLWVTGEEVLRSLEHLRLDRSPTTQVGHGRNLDDAERIFGRFFFVRVSRSETLRDRLGPGAVAFEFLHNLFGEYLAAEFMLRRIADEVNAVSTFTADRGYAEELERKLRGGFGRGWFAVFGHTCIHSRPVIISMLRSLVAREPTLFKGGRETFERHFDVIVRNELTRALMSSELPVGYSDSRERSGEPLSMLGFLATYTANLVLLRAVLCTTPLVIDESEWTDDRGGRGGWDRLLSLWDSWFADHSFVGWEQLIQVQRENGLVEVRQRTAGKGRSDILGSIFHARANVGSRVDRFLDEFMQSVDRSQTSEMRADQIIPFARLASSITGDFAFAEVCRVVVDVSSRGGLPRGAHEDALWLAERFPGSGLAEGLGQVVPDPDGEGSSGR